MVSVAKSSIMHAVAPPIVARLPPRSLHHPPSPAHRIFHHSNCLLISQKLQASHQSPGHCIIVVPSRQHWPLRRRCIGPRAACWWRHGTPVRTGRRQCHQAHRPLAIRHHDVKPPRTSPSHHSRLNTVTRHLRASAQLPTLNPTIASLPACIQPGLQHGL
jgi:hypothetical protein